MANSISVAVGDSDTMRRGRCAMVTVVPPGCAIETGKRVPGDALLVAGDDAQALRNNSATTTTLGTRAAGFAPALCSCIRMRQPPAATAPTTPRTHRRKRHPHLSTPLSETRQ